jgi:hypothetical protein
MDVTVDSILKLCIFGTLGLMDLGLLALTNGMRGLATDRVGSAAPVGVSS